MKESTGEAMKLLVLLGRYVCALVVILGLSLFLVLAISPTVEAQNLLWAKRAGGTGFDAGVGTVDSSGNSYVTGSFSGSATFGLGEIHETSLVSTGSDMFVAKYDSSGALLWAKGASGTAFSYSTGIQVDDTGNSYVIGSFDGSATFGSGETNETTLVSTSTFGGPYGDIFVAKYSSNGALAWAKRAGGTDYTYPSGIALDGSGNSYVIGEFLNSVTFGPGETNETTLVSAGSQPIFIAQYNSNGALARAKRIAGAGDDAAIAVDRLENVYVTGNFGDFFVDGSETFGLGDANQITLISAGSADIFVAKYDSSWALVWAKRAGGTGSDTGRGIAVDGSGISYVTGRFSGSATFGPGEINETTLISAGSEEIFVAKYGSSGALLWAKGLSGTGTSFSFPDIAVDGSGNSYVIGSFGGFDGGSATFGLGEANETTLTSAGSNDVFVAKYNSSGALQWAKRAGGTTDDDAAGGIAVDGSGNSYVTGSFGGGGGSATFGLGEANETTLTSAGDSDIFVAKFAGGVVAPDTLINSGPAANGGATNSTSAIFNFTSTDPSASFACSLDNGAFSACTSPKTYIKLKVGNHIFRVQATATGATDPTPAIFNWTIDTIAPNTTITSGPPVLTNNAVATFNFTSTEAGGGFLCSLDGGAFALCASPFISAPLADGKHNFQVKATDAAGNADKSVAKAKAWTVDATPPDTTLTALPANPTTSTSATFKFTSTEKKSAFQCNLDGTGFNSCKKRQTFSGLPVGAHNFQVRAIDGAGNVDPTPAIFNWTIQ